MLLYEGLKKYEKYFILPKIETKADPGWFGFLITVRKNVGVTRDEIVKYLENNKIAQSAFCGEYNLTSQFQEC